jgi:hypothetical protein
MYPTLTSFAVTPVLSPAAVCAELEVASPAVAIATIASTAAKALRSDRPLRTILR